MSNIFNLSFQQETYIFILLQTTLFVLFGLILYRFIMTLLRPFMLRGCKHEDVLIEKDIDVTFNTVCYKHICKRCGCIKTVYPMESYRTKKGRGVGRIQKGLRQKLSKQNGK